MGMQQHSNSPQSMHGAPSGLVMVSVVLAGFMVSCEAGVCPLLASVAGRLRQWNESNTKKKKLTTR